MFFTLKKDLKMLECFMHFPKKKVLVLRMQKEKETSKGNYLVLSLMLSYNDGPKVWINKGNLYLS